MKRSISLFTALIIIFNLTMLQTAADTAILLGLSEKKSARSLSAGSSDALTDITADGSEVFESLIIADDGVFKTVDEARETIFEIVGEISLGETYQNLFYGFSAEITHKAAKTLEASGKFEVHICGEFAEVEAFDKDKSISSGTVSDTYKAVMAYAADTVSPPLNEQGEPEFTGRGIRVAVIDDGFDITHPAFAKAPDGASFTRDELDRILDEGELVCSALKELPEGIYKSAKIPFAYNYASNTSDVSTLNNHGTHVAGIIGADCEELVGIAPDCQLFLMKTFDERIGTATEINVLKALEDAMTLEVDIVNLSIGMYSGFSESGALTAMGRAARALERAGITVNCAAGNDGTIGKQSANYRNYKFNLPKSELTDYGTINSPAALSGFTAVASAQNTYTADNALIHSENNTERRIPYSDTNAELGLIKGRFIDYFDGQTLEYVLVPNQGEAEDYRRIDVYGKLALVERGGITFIEKVNNAASAGALGVLIYNNSATDTNVKMDITDCPIPAVLISLEDGAYLKKAERREIIFSTGLCGFKENPNALTMSEFSSWGVTPELDLKPDITAVGDSVYSAAAGGHYTSLSGTSMATPIISGACALIYEKLDREQSKYISSNRPDHVKALLMNTAAVLTDPATDAEYSPRNQGAGLVNISGAAAAELLITDIDRYPSHSLGDKLSDSFVLGIALENLTEDQLEVTLDASLLSESAVTASVDGKALDGLYNSLKLKQLKSAKILAPHGENINKNAEATDKYTVFVPAGQSIELELEMVLDTSELPPESHFKNGFFIDGFVYAHTENGEYSLPFTGFYGDFSASPIFDTTRYSDLDAAPYLYGNLLLSTIQGKYSVLGSDDLSINGNILARYACFSPNGDGYFDTLYFTPSVFRNITELSFEIRSSTGELLFSDNISRRISKSDSAVREYYMAWDGSDDMNYDYIFPDGDYFISVFAKCYNGGKDGITAPVKIDTQAPSLSDFTVSETNGRKMLTVTVSDNVKVRKVEVYSGEAVLSQLDDGDDIFVFDITELHEDTLWADITDYAMNTKTDRLNINEN